MAHWLDKVTVLLTADTNDLHELARIAGSDPRTFYIGVDPSSLELDGQNIDDIEFSTRDDFFVDSFDGRSISLPLDGSNLIVDVKRLTSAIRNHKRQEERLAILLRLILQNRRTALPILTTYGKDKAKSANAALSELAAAIKDEQSQRSLFDQKEIPHLFGHDLVGPASDYKLLGDDILVTIASRPYAKNMPGTRSFLLYYMTKYLSDFPKVNALLRSKVGKSQSVFVAPNLSEMYEFLRNPPEVRWDDILQLSMDMPLFDSPS
ncbi:hypothetical protein [Tardiphaga sp. OK245]|uniref:hypothetical protein n=1 Tax=Tardiphaga sp. OK245 TaxID=1855306 RepID=UPI0008A7E725|nr:hypothetical protein [Tardiphaga sp. OK245]SEI15768.1 hypothetical protein SAMN05216367_4243 [Tardiphaga sp. OK245]